jgi:hypothetical protein
VTTGYVLAMIGFVGGVVVLLVLVATLLMPPLRRFTHARAALRRTMRSEVAALRAIRHARGSGASPST